MSLVIMSVRYLCCYRSLLKQYGPAVLPTVAKLPVGVEIRMMRIQRDVNATQVGADKFQG